MSDGRVDSVDNLVLAALLGGDVLHVVSLVTSLLVELLDVHDTLKSVQTAVNLNLRRIFGRAVIHVTPCDDGVARAFLSPIRLLGAHGLCSGLDGPVGAASVAGWHDGDLLHAVLAASSPSWHSSSR